MVQDSGKTLCSGTFKPVNLPEPVSVEESASGLPVSVSPHPMPYVRPYSAPVSKIAGKRAIIAIEDIWRIDDEWWRSEPVSRLYYAVRFFSGQRLVIYKDLLTGRWYRQEY